MMPLYHLQLCTPMETRLSHDATLLLTIMYANGNKTITWMPLYYLQLCMPMFVMILKAVQFQCTCGKGLSNSLWVACTWVQSGFLQ